MRRDGKKMFQILDSMKAGLGDIPMGVKMRTGWDQKSVNAHSLISQLVDKDYNLHYVAVHGRTRRQRWVGLLIVCCLTSLCVIVLI